MHNVFKRWKVKLSLLAYLFSSIWGCLICNIIDSRGRNSNLFIYSDWTSDRFKFWNFITYQNGFLNFIRFCINCLIESSRYDLFIEIRKIGSFENMVYCVNLLCCINLFDVYAWEWCLMCLTYVFLFLLLLLLLLLFFLRAYRFYLRFDERGLVCFIRFHLMNLLLKSVEK